MCRAITLAVATLVCHGCDGPEIDSVRYSCEIDSDCGNEFVCVVGVCRRVRCPTPSQHTPETLCTDSVDNDRDGGTDCFDHDCRSHESCTNGGLPSPEVSIETCSDGIDNDGDGFVDCRGFSCSRDSTPDVVQFCAGRKEDTLEKCLDGIDNDGDGFPDCEDFFCLRDSTPNMVQACADRTEDTLEECSDGVDNDGDGFLDCASFTCSRNSIPVVADYCARIERICR